MVEGLLDEFHGAKFFSKLDLRPGYHQIKMRSDDEFKIAFWTHHVLWKFKVMPFGVTNSPATFRALMQGSLWVIYQEVCPCFFYDILIYSFSLHDHVQHLE